MKPIQKLVILVFLFTSFNSAFAQYSNSGYGGGYNRGYGSGYGGGSRMSQMNGGMSQERDKPKEIPVEVTVGKIMDNLKSRIDLDELQVIAISNILTESIRSQGIIMKQETSQEAKINDIKALSEITDSKVMVLLNSDQKEKYLLMKDEFKNPKKAKSDKKSKKEAKKEKETEE
jgi:acylphosphatase